METAIHDGNPVGLMLPPVQVVWRTGDDDASVRSHGEYQHTVAAHSGPTGVVMLAHRLGALGFHVAGAGEYRPTQERAPAPGRPSDIEVLATDRDGLALVQPVRRTIG